MKWIFIGLAAYATILMLLSQIDFNFPKIELFMKRKFNLGEIIMDYDEYRFLDSSAMRFGNHEILLRFESFSSIQHFIVNNDTMIIIISKRLKDTHKLNLAYFLYKLDIFGNVIDSIEFNEQTRADYEYFYEGYLINTDRFYYRTWAMDGDKTKRHIIVENKDMQWKDSLVKEFLNEKYKQASIFFRVKIEPENFNGDEKTYYKVFYFLSNNWHVCFQQEDYKKKEAIKGAKLHYSLFDFHFDRNGHWSANPYANIKYCYFYKWKREDVQLYSFNPRTPLIKGFLCTQLEVGGDILKIKDELYLFEEFEKNTEEIKKLPTNYFIRSRDLLFSPYLYYTNSNFEFDMFTNDPEKLYFIKKIDFKY